MKSSFFVSAASAVLLSSSLVFARSLQFRFTEDTFIDDANSSEILYFGNWTHVSNQGLIDWMGTESYSNDPSAQYTFGGVQEGGGITLFAAKTSSRRDFDVWQGTFKLGTASAYNATCSANCSTTEIFNIENLPTSESITVINNITEKNDDGSIPYLAIDGILILVKDECAEGQCP